MKRHALPLAATAAVVFGVVLALAAMAPPAPQPASAPPEAFSAERALAHVRQIARAPHPPGSAEHARVRDYLRAAFEALGLKTEIQRTLAVRDEGDQAVVVPVENVVAHRPGTSGETLFLAAHYDSHPTGPGAGDDAAGVATLLETARALGAAPLRNPIVFLVTDAEEVGLVGAEGFVAASPDARPGVVLNFEARGGGGPVFMFETGDGNSGLVRALGESVARPCASSLMYALYKLLPNDTDLSVFKRAGYSGLNFAFVDRYQNYHTALDTPERLDLRSLQQHGDYAVALARRLGGEADLARLADRGQGDSVYFDVLGRALVRYPVALTWLWSGLAVALFVGALVRARDEARFGKALAIGAALGLATLLVAGALGLAVGLLAAPGQVGAPNRSPYGARYGEAGLYLLAAAAAAGLWLLALRRLPLRPVALGALIWWVAALLAATVWLTAGAYLFVWPLLFALAGLLPREPRAWHALSGLPTLLLWPVILHGLFLLMGYSLTAVFGALAAFALLPILPALRLCGGWLPALAALAAAACLAVGLPPHAPSADEPRVCTLLHYEDTETHDALRASLDRASDWSKAALGDRAAKKPGRFFFPWSDATFRAAATRPLGLRPPSVTRRGKFLRVAPAPGQRQIVVWTDAAVRQASVGARSLPLVDGRLCVRCIAPPPDGIELLLEAPAGTEVMVDGYTDGLPPDVAPRPSGWIAASVAPQTDVLIARRRWHW